jgi:hypothetical protein
MKFHLRAVNGLSATQSLIQEVEVPEDVPVIARPTIKDRHAQQHKDSSNQARNSQILEHKVIDKKPNDLCGRKRDDRRRNQNLRRVSKTLALTASRSFSRTTSTLIIAA